MQHRIIGIGEILWDIFPDGPRFGGAPANFSCSAAELAKETARVYMVSAVGTDDLGREAVESLARRGVDTTYVQMDESPTGKVIVELDKAGIASYRFTDDSAWDHLSWNDKNSEAASHCNAICFGTLGQRNERSRFTIQEFVKATPDSALRILDVNLREPFYDDEVIRESLTLANVLKLNDDELPFLARINDLTGSDVEIMRQLAEEYQFGCVALTRGERGAAIVSGKAVSDLPGVPVKVADTVGAGDAFTAAMTLGLLAKKNIETVNKSAIAIASYVCSQPGATMPFPESLLQTS